MSALLALIPTKDKIYLVGIVLLIVLGFYVHNKILAEGIAEQQAADARAAATLDARVKKQTAELQAKATMVEQAYDKEHQAILNQPPSQPVRLCLDSHPRGGQLPKVGASVAGNATAGASAASVQPVPSGDPSSGPAGVGPDISGMLSALSASADQVSATLREYQTRGR